MEHAMTLMQAMIEELAEAGPLEAAPWTAARLGLDAGDVLRMLKRDQPDFLHMRRAEARYARICGQLAHGLWQIDHMLDLAERLHARIPAPAYAIMKTRGEGGHWRKGIFKSRPSAGRALAGHRMALAELTEAAEEARETLRAAVAGAQSPDGHTDVLREACEALEPVAAKLDGELGGAWMALETLRFIDDPAKHPDPGL